MPVIGGGQPAKFRYALNPLAYTWVSGSTSNANVHTSYAPGVLLADLIHPRQYTRSTDLATATAIVLDFGAQTAVACFSFENYNTPSITLQGSNTDSSGAWASPAYAETFTTVAADPNDGRRKYLAIPAGTGTPFNYRYARIVLSTVDAANGGFRYLGALGAWATLTSLLKNFGAPFDIEFDDRALEEELVGGGEEVSDETPMRLVFSTASAYQRANSAARAQFTTLANYPRSKVLLLDRNLGDLTEWYHVRRAAKFRITRDNTAKEQMTGIVFRQVV